MSARETILGLFRGKFLKRIPLTTYNLFVPRGQKGKELRDHGLILIDFQSPCISEYHDVEVEIKRAQVQMSIREKREPYQEVWTRIYHTPVGDVSEKIVREKEYGTSDWVAEHLIKKPSDYEIVRYVVEHCTNHENYKAIEKAQDDFGEDGIIYAMLDRTPVQQLIVEWAGVERFSMDLYDYPHLVEKLISSVQKQQDRVYEIAVHSPAEVIWAPDNLMGDIVGPTLYKRYFLPFYNKQAELIHEHDKLYAVHMDGRLAPLTHLIKQTNVDIVDSFSLPGAGGGDLSITEALKMWEGKSILANIPAPLGLKSPDEIRAYIRDLKKEVSPFGRFALQFSEDLPTVTLWETLSAIADALAEEGTG